MSTYVDSFAVCCMSWPISSPEHYCDADAEVSQMNPLMRSTVAWKLEKHCKTCVRRPTPALPGYTWALGLCFLICRMVWQWHRPCRVFIMTIRWHCISREQYLACCRHSINMLLWCPFWEEWGNVSNHAVLLGGRDRLRTQIQLPLEAESGHESNVNFLDVFEVGFKEIRQISLECSSSWKDGTFSTRNGMAITWSPQGHWSI